MHFNSNETIYSISLDVQTRHINKFTTHAACQETLLKREWLVTRICSALDAGVLTRLLTRLKTIFIFQIIIFSFSHSFVF